MTRKEQILWAIILDAFLIATYLFWLGSQMQVSSAPQVGGAGQPYVQTATTSESGATAPMTANVTFDGTSFSPASVTIAQGGTVTWTSTGKALWVASNPHPIHNGYDGTTLQEHCAPGYTGATPFDQCAGGMTYSFTFDKVGTWGYHDHLQASIRGSVTVVQE